MPHVTDGSLYSILTHLPDARQAQGQLHAPPSLLTGAVAAIPCGRTTPAAARRGRDSNHLLGHLGFANRRGDRRRSPRFGDPPTASAGLDADASEGPPRPWLPADGVGGVVAIDGKGPRGPRAGGCWPRCPSATPTGPRRRQRARQIPAGRGNAALRLLHKNKLSGIASAPPRRLAAFPMKAVQLVTQGRITDL